MCYYCRACISLHARCTGRHTYGTILGLFEPQLQPSTAPQQQTWVVPTRACVHDVLYEYVEVGTPQCNILRRVACFVLIWTSGMCERRCVQVDSVIRWCTSRDHSVPHRTEFLFATFSTWFYMSRVSLLGAPLVVSTSAKNKSRLARTLGLPKWVTCGYVWLGCYQYGAMWTPSPQEGQNEQDTGVMPTQRSIRWGCFMLLVAHSVECSRVCGDKTG